MVFNEDWYNNNQINDLITLANSVNKLDGNIIEIGCWEGKSTTALANAIYPETIICNDTWLGNVAESELTGQTHITIQILQERDVYNTFLDNMNTMTKKNYKIIKDDYLNWLKTYNEKIKFCHIDASHEYDSVYKTIELLLPNVISGGILCGDDFATANIGRKDLHGGVERAVREHFPDCKTLSNGNLWYWIKP
jgi:hypothetical protein